MLLSFYSSKARKKKTAEAVGPACSRVPSRTEVWPGKQLGVGHGELLGDVSGGKEDWTDRSNMAEFWEKRRRNDVKKANP